MLILAGAQMCCFGTVQRQLFSGQVLEYLDFRQRILVMYVSFSFPEIVSGNTSALFIPDRIRVKISVIFVELIEQPKVAGLVSQLRVLC